MTGRQGFTWNAWSPQLLPCCPWTLGNVYMHVGKSIFISPPQTGFTWYMDMVSDTLLAKTKQIRITRLLGVDLSTARPVAPSYRARSGKGRATSYPEKLKVPRHCIQIHTDIIWTKVLGRLPTPVPKIMTLHLNM